MDWKNLAPNLIRQRLIIEGQMNEMPSLKKVKNYLIGLSKVSGMKVIIKPKGISNHPGGGIGIWIHWSTS